MSAPMPKRPIPQVEVDRVAQASTDLLDIAKALLSLSDELENPQQAALLQSHAERMLNVVDALGGTLRSVAYG